MTIIKRNYNNDSDGDDIKNNNGGNGNDITMILVIMSKIMMEIEMVMMINYFLKLNILLKREKLSKNCIKYLTKSKPSNEDLNQIKMPFTS